MATATTDCDTPQHARAVRLAAEADYAAEVLRGLDIVVLGFTEFAAINHVGRLEAERFGLLITSAFEPSTETPEVAP